MLVVHDRRFASAYRREFQRVSQGRPRSGRAPHGITPAQLLVSRVPVRVLFAPEHAPEMEIMKQMLKARERIDFAVFTFSRSSGIDDTMIHCARLGVPVTGVLDGLQVNQRWAASRPVRNAGAALYRAHRRNGLGKLHHKLMVLDRQVVIAGSFNYTRAASRVNDENIVIVGDFEAPGRRARSAQRRFARYALKEIERIIVAHGVAI